MLEYPWFLLLLLGLLFLLKSKRFHLRHAYTRAFSPSKSFKSYSKALNWLGFVLIVLAAANFHISLKENKKISLVHKYVLINDASGSMVDTNKKRGVGKELEAVLEGNDKFLAVLKDRDDGTKDYVGAIVFSDDAFIVSPLVDDPVFVKKKMVKIDYGMSPLSWGTNIENAVWAGVRMILNHGEDKKDNLFDLQRQFYGVGKLDKRAKVEEFIAKKDKFTGSSLIIFTDGWFFGLEGNPNWMSTLKLLDFCKYMGIRVYFFSVEKLPLELKRYTRDTGGSSAILGKIDKQQLGKLYEDIAKNQAKEYVTKEVSINKSYSEWLGILGLIFIVLGIIIHNTFERSFTEV